MWFLQSDHFIQFDSSGGSYEQILTNTKQLFDEVKRLVH